MVIAISVVEITCAVYTFFVAYMDNGSQLKYLFSLRFIFLGLGFLISLPIIVITIVTYIAYMQSDEIASLALTLNYLTFASATILPFWPLLALLYCITDYREYEINGQSIEFEPNYHQASRNVNTALLQASHQNTQTQDRLSKNERQQIRDLTIRLLKSYLDEPIALSVPIPDLERQKPEF